MKISSVSLFSVSVLSVIALCLFSFSNGAQVFKCNPPPGVPCQVACALGVCGNGVCEPNASESCRNCPMDCGECPNCNNICGDHRCEPQYGESACTCPQDCGVCCQDGFCMGAESPANCPSDCTGSLRGEVYDASTYTVLVNASIVCRSVLTDAQGVSLKNVTDTNGHFVFHGQVADEYTCCASYSTYSDNCQSIKFTPGAQYVFNRVIRIPLSNKYGSISGFVFEKITTVGISRTANVSCYYSNSTAEFNTFTTVKGAFWFYNINPDVYSCLIRKPGYYPVSFTVNVTRGSNTQVNGTLNVVPSGLSGVVSEYGSGNVLTGASTTCAKVGEEKPFPSIPTSVDGRFTLNNILPGEYRCSASLTGYLRISGTTLVGPGSNATLNLVLRPHTGSVKGIVSDSQGILSRAVVTCSNANLRTVSSFETGLDGAYRVTFLPPDTYTCTASRFGYNSTMTTITITPGSLTTNNFLLVKS